MGPAGLLGDLQDCLLAALPAGLLAGPLVGVQAGPLAGPLSGLLAVPAWPSFWILGLRSRGGQRVSRQEKFHRPLPSPGSAGPSAGSRTREGHRI